jgi:hypothetical protein
MTPLRKKRLLLLALRPKWHKRFYSQYYYLIGQGLIEWQLGTAFLTDKGRLELSKMIDGDK